MSWPTAKLGDLCHINMGKTPSRHEPRYWAEFGHIWLSIADLGKAREAQSSKEKITDVAVKESGIKVVRKGTVLMSFKLSIGKVAIAQRDLFTNEAIAALPIRDSGVLCEEYLAHALEAIDFSQAGSRAVMGATLNKKSLSDIDIPLPPLEEQKRIAGILDQADALRRLRARALQKLNTLGLAVFQEMFGGSASFPSKKIKDFAVIKGGKRLPKGSEYSDVITRHPYIRVSDIGNHRIDTRNLKYISEEVQSSIWRYTVSVQDVIISIAGSIGITATVPIDLDGANLTENAAKITPIQSGAFNPAYIDWALSSPKAQQQITENTGQVTIGKLALFRIETIEIPFPPLDMQDEFERRIKEIENAHLRQLHAVNKSEALFGSLQSAAFQGKL